VVERVLVALAYAHGFHDETGQLTPIVHRDISPSNVLLDWSGGVKIADFGIAKVLGVSTGTRVGIVKGTLGCMAPEQARGEAVDERADVYAAALLAWRLATGRVPFAKHQADEFELLRAMRNPRIKPLDVLRPDLPEPLLRAIARALEPDPRQRTITAAQLAAIVSEHIDVGAGWLELATLLEKWKHALERSVKRVPSVEATESSENGDARVESTLRYEEVALAFDEEPPPDAPTIEAHALPSDASALAALPFARSEEQKTGPVEAPGVLAAASMALPAAQVEFEVQTPAEPSAPVPRSGGALRARTARSWGRFLVVAAVLAVGVAAALLTTLCR
jgi:serine/threonine protein kinase